MVPMYLVYILCFWMVLAGLLYLILIIMKKVLKLQIMLILTKNGIRK